MKTINHYYHNNASKVMNLRNNYTHEIESAIGTCQADFAPSHPALIKAHFTKYLIELGWSENVRVDKRIQATVNFMKMDVVFILQLGNVARTYADLIKITHLSNLGLIKLGVIALACKPEAKLLGANYANYERLVSELKVYEKIFQTPLLILGLGN